MFWYEKAACHGKPTKLFFSSDEEKTGMRRKREVEAKKICAICTVVEECLDAGQLEDGIWGGLTRAERQGVSRKKTQLERPLANFTNTDNSPWVIIETNENFAVWQRDSEATWHGVEWAVVKNDKILQIFDDLNNAYIMFGNLLHP